MVKLNLNSIEGRDEAIKRAKWKKVLADRYWLNISLEDCVEFYIQLREIRGDIA
jgi:hypothetical protein